MPEEPLTATCHAGMWRAATEGIDELGDFMGLALPLVAHGPRGARAWIVTRNMITVVSSSAEGQAGRVKRLRRSLRC